MGDISFVAVNSPEIARNVGVTLEAVAPATVRSEQHHAETTDSDRWDVVKKKESRRGE
jgi:hypothetical protein